MFLEKKRGASPASLIEVIEHQNARRRRMKQPLLHELPKDHQLSPGNRKRRQHWLGKGAAA